MIVSRKVAAKLDVQDECDVFCNNNPENKLAC